MNRVLSNKKAVVIFLLPALVLFLTIIIVPIFMSVTYSLTEWDGIGKRYLRGLITIRSCSSPTVMDSGGQLRIL